MARTVNMSDLINRFVTYIINPLIAILFALALALFMWGIARFIWTSDDDTSREQGKKHMIWGLVGMLIMVSVYGILNVATSLLGIPPR